MTTSLDARTLLAEALALDLVGPGETGPYVDERLPGYERPSKWYLTGFLTPVGGAARRDDDPDDGDLDEVPEREGDEGVTERAAARRQFFPSSLGLSFLVPSQAPAVGVSVHWADYVEEPVEGEARASTAWQRYSRVADVDVKLDASDPIPVPGSGGLELVVSSRTVGQGAGLPAGTQSVSVFLINRRTAVIDTDASYAFQAGLVVECHGGFVPRPDLRGESEMDWDDRVGSLHYADVPEFATGHGVAVDWSVVDGICRSVRTVWLPSATVERTVTETIDSAELRMMALGALSDGASAIEALAPIVSAYRAWLDDRTAEVDGLEGARRETAHQLVHLGQIAAGRIERGIQLLDANEEALDAFRVANRAVGRALQRRLRVEEPRWRAFQLAFILMNLQGIADPSDVDRETVDLLFFPTGGGKTEAYLGLAAFAMVYRRLRSRELGPVAGSGVSVIMRYTLRLLTLDQLGRAAGLICALELERGGQEHQYGEWPFEIGLWVGKAATPNILGRRGDGRSDSARAKVAGFIRNPKLYASPIPLEACPWCGRDFEPSSFTLHPNANNPTELRVTCRDFECEFSGDRALPIIAVDESIYRRLPAFLIATVDKFAALPWVGPTGLLLGDAERHDADGFYGAVNPGRGTRLAANLPPPDLVIQDELHLISGPLGTMAGLYETAIDALCRRGGSPRPKVVASTATVRRAADQIQALFGRPDTQIFPPPGPDRRDSFFAQTVPANASPGRLYVGVAAPGRNPKVVMRRVLLALMGAAERIYRDEGGHHEASNPADPYMTVVAYFNALRELGGARRIVEEEVQNTLREYGRRRRLGEERGLFADRKSFKEVVELTSRVSTDAVASARDRLSKPFDQPDRVDVALATNMISVGLDISRLGLMIVLGQPKTHSEYIQATSRVGRDEHRPGLVVTVLNAHKPRDRSHFERFRHYHETFYRAVEVASVTPFSARALDRGLAGALVGLARHTMPELEPATGAGVLKAHRASLEETVLETFRERVGDQPIVDEEDRKYRLRAAHDRIVDLLDSWQYVVDSYAANSVAVQYQRYEKDGPKPLLREMLDTDFESEHHRKFRVNRSLRDVEPSVNVFLRDLNGATIGGDE